MVKKDKAEISRRLFLSTAGAVTAISATGVSLANAHNNKEDSKFDYDVIVIGGGFAGITASRDLMKSGFKTVVLEARNRLGGRTFTANFGGHHVELGGTWFHWFQPHVWAEVNRYGLEIDEMVPPQEEMASILIDGKPEVSPLMDRAELAFDALEKLFPNARQIWERPYDQSYSWELLVAEEPATVRERLDAADLTPAQRVIVESFVSTMAHTTLDKASYVEMARWYAAAGWNFFDLLDTTGRYMFKDGTISLINAMVKDGGQKIQMSTVVAKVTQATDHVIVETEDGEILTARVMVSTIPMNVLGDVEFIPPLAKIKIQAAQERHGGEGVKIYAEVEGDLNKILCFSPDSETVSLWVTYKELKNSTLLIGFGPYPDAIDPNDTLAVQESIRKHVPNAKVIASTGYLWVQDSFAQGTYCSYRPGQLARFGKELTRHEGRFFMGSGDHGEGWRGFIDGAIARGSKVAQDVKNFLREDQ